MKKTLIISILLGLILLLSGCDGILEAFYPEFAPKDEWKEEELFGVEVRVIFPGDSTDWDLHHDNAVFVLLYRDGEAEPCKDYVTDNEDNFWVTFFDLPEGDYYFIIFWDYEGGDNPGYGFEPVYDGQLAAGEFHLGPADSFPAITIPIEDWIMP